MEGEQEENLTNALCLVIWRGWDTMTQSTEIYLQQKGLQRNILHYEIANSIPDL